MKEMCLLMESRCAMTFGMIAEKSMANGMLRSFVGSWDFPDLRALQQILGNVLAYV